MTENTEIKTNEVSVEVYKQESLRLKALLKQVKEAVDTVPSLRFMSERIQAELDTVKIDKTQVS